MRRSEATSILATAPFVLAATIGGRGQTAAHLSVAGPPTEDLTAFYFAIKSGRFEAAGLDVDLVGTSSGSAAVTAVIAGTYQVAKTSLLSVFAAHLRGIPITIVAPEVMFTPRNPFALLQAATDASYKTGADLNGKTIGVPSLGDLNTLATEAWVDRNGGEWRSLKFVEMPNAVMEAALQQHRIDAAMMQPPQLDASLAARTTKTIGDGYAAIAPAFFVGAFVARADWAAQQADTVRRFRRVMGDANAYVNGHAKETLPLVTELTKIPQSVLEKMHRSYNGTSLDARAIQPLIDAAAKYGLITSGFSAKEILFS